MHKAFINYKIQNSSKQCQDLRKLKDSIDARIWFDINLKCVVASHFDTKLRVRECQIECHSCISQLIGDDWHESLLRRLAFLKWYRHQTEDDFDNKVWTFMHNACIFATLTYIHKHIHTYTHTYIHTHIHTYIHTYIHTHTRTYIHTYIHTRMHDYKNGTWMHYNWIDHT